MSVARVTEISSTSSTGFEDAVKSGLKRARKTLKNISGAWVESQEVVLEDGKIKGFKVRMKVTFVLKD